MASGSPPWKLDDASLQNIVPEIRQHTADSAIGALDELLIERAGAFINGLETYRTCAYRRPEEHRAVVWENGAARLLDYDGGAGGQVVLLVPSLINRYYILDLLPERSFASALAHRGLRPLVLDWREPSELERHFKLDDYIVGPLAAALAAAAEFAGGPVILGGYCMGGLLALAAATRAPDSVAGLALLATPWDFHAAHPEQPRMLASLAEWLPRLLPDDQPLPVAVIQSLFAALDPFLAERKFVRFAAMHPDSDAARGFVALEDWINDGVPLARGVALDCAHSWYRDNEPMRGAWHVAGIPVLPEAVAVRTLVVVPSRDRIVPPRSAEPLAKAITQAAIMRPPLGHIGMMSSIRAPSEVWHPIADWIHGRFGARP